VLQIYQPGRALHFRLNEEDYDNDDNYDDEDADDNGEVMGCFCLGILFIKYAMFYRSFDRVREIYGILNMKNRV
jgi:hypothetical protein